MYSTEHRIAFRARVLRDDIARERELAEQYHRVPAFPVDWARARARELVTLARDAGLLAEQGTSKLRAS